MRGDSMLTPPAAHRVGGGYSSMRGDSMLTPPPAHLSPAGLDRMFFVGSGSTLSLTGVTLQNGQVRLTDNPARGGACSGAAIQRILQRLFAAAFALHQWRCSFRIDITASPQNPPLFSSPLRCRMMLVLAPSSSTATWTPRHARSRTILLRYVAGSVLVLQSLSPPPPLFLYTPVVKSV
jgi:hypothetical protein